MAPASPTARRARRPFPSPSISKSPDSDPLARPKRLKQEDIDHGVDGQAPSVASETSSTSNGRTRRKPKEKEKDSGKNSEKDRPRSDDAAPDSAPDAVQPAAEEEENGVTRCICGREDDPDAGEFMVQCETCKVWQHGLCMGYDSEAQLHDDDYYCEQCRPEFHTEYLNPAKGPPLVDDLTPHHHCPAPQSRSHSPPLLKQPSKRRNTMNSRDAAFDENLKEILETTAAEAGATHDSAAPTNGNGHPDVDEDGEPTPPNRKKRKRTEDDAPAKKRTRSASSASDRRMDSAVPRDESPPPAKVAPAPKAPGRRRGGRKAVVHELVVSIEGEEGPSILLPSIPSAHMTITSVPLPAPSKRGHGGRAKGAAAKNRNAAAAAPQSMIHDHATRRNPTQPTNGHPSTTPAESSRAYRNSHAYAVSQQPMFTSWGLPDYLAHLEAILPTDVPQPLEVLSAGAPNTSRAGSLERTQERGVKVKWPSKRMSVGDMNKRVRALVEWVGREQASASERSKRKEALEAALREELATDALAARHAPEGSNIDGVPPIDDSAMALDLPLVPATATSTAKFDVTQASVAMKMMEELMEELIRFQERFGPGSKRERR
ncbi:putative histone deacetylase complex subunit cti6 [Mycena venus]|uniref:Putative histone deacetylase complex subunit cti6 n=1 Tax=Mycena venus TaxID=2733690 RepID=A0A8H6YNF3_9AGAR|nr:putative histone deacetylase complex subunit cti6 [Mycena venus]